MIADADIESEIKTFIDSVKEKVEIHIYHENERCKESSQKPNKAAQDKVESDYKKVADYYIQRVNNWNSVRYTDACPESIDTGIKADVLGTMCRECWGKEEKNNAWDPIVKFLRAELLATLCCEIDRKRNLIFRELLNIACQEGVHKNSREDAAMQACYRLFYPSPGWAREPKLPKYDSDRLFLPWFYWIARRYFRDYAKMEKHHATQNTPLVYEDDDTFSGEIDIEIPDTSKEPFALVSEKMILEEIDRWQKENDITKRIKSEDDEIFFMFLRFYARKLIENGFLRQGGYFPLLEKMNGNRSATLKIINAISLNADEKELTKNASENIFYQAMDSLVVVAVKEWGYDISLAKEYIKRRPKDLKKPIKELDNLGKG